MIVGIHQAQSLHLTDIARSLGEDIGLHATHKRLSRNLANKALAEFISDALLQRAAEVVTQDTILVVSYYSLHKQFATHMQYIHGDDSNSHDDGYHVCDIAAVDPASPESYTPLLSRLWSRHAPDYTSDAAEILTAVNQVHSATEGNGVFFCRTPMADHVMWALAQEPDLRTVFRVANVETPFIVDKKLSTLSELVPRVELPYGNLIFKMATAAGVRHLIKGDEEETVETSLFLQFGGLPVRLPDTEKPATLILTRRTLDRAGIAAPGDTIAYLATGTKAETHEALWPLLQNQYLTIDAINAGINHKSRFSQSDFRVLTYDRLQLLNVLLHAVTHYEAYIDRTFRIDNHPISKNPHQGDHPRDFIVPQVLA